MVGDEEGSAKGRRHARIEGMEYIFGGENEPCDAIIEVTVDGNAAAKNVRTFAFLSYTPIWRHAASAHTLFDTVS